LFFFLKKKSGFVFTLKVKFFLFLLDRSKCGYGEEEKRDISGAA
jgi:hypothetical protein